MKVEKSKNSNGLRSATSTKNVCIEIQPTSYIQLYLATDIIASIGLVDLYNLYVEQVDCVWSRNRRCWHGI